MSTPKPDRAVSIYTTPEAWEAFRRAHIGWADQLVVDDAASEAHSLKLQGPIEAVTAMERFDLAREVAPAPMPTRGEVTVSMAEWDEFKESHPYTTRALTPTRTANGFMYVTGPTWAIEKMNDAVWPPQPDEPAQEQPVEGKTARQILEILLADDNPASELESGEIDRALRWWRDLAEADSRATIPKAQEYGSTDLEMMGAAMAALIKDKARENWERENAGRSNVPGIEDEFREFLRVAGIEMAIAFYALGKAARLFSSYQQGRRPKDDTWLDLTVYSVMGRFVREHGRWL